MTLKLGDVINSLDTLETMPERYQAIEKLLEGSSDLAELLEVDSGAVVFTPDTSDEIRRELIEVVREEWSPDVHFEEVRPPQ